VLGYEVLKKLADGAAAEAFLAREEGSQDRVILEILRPELASDAELIERFLDEAKVRQTLEHPNVTRRVSTGRTADGRLFVVTEPVDGENLSATLWSQGSLAVQDVIRLMLPLCDALEYLHRAGVIHGNVKPDNVYLSGGLEAFNPKLLDYGLALFRDGNRIRTTGSLEHTEPEYQAPECIRGEKADPRADVYALGILMYEALTGFPPFTAGSPSEILRKQRDEAPPALPASRAELAPIIYRCLSKDPDHRYPSASALREALAEQLEGRISEPTTAISGSQEPAQEKEGDVLGSFELIKLLGEGAMGRVFAARHVRLGRKVALKLLRPEKARDHLLVERFFQEARAANQINHEHIVEIFDFVEEPQDRRRVYFVMELLAGVSLGDLLRAGPLSIQRAVKIARQLCAALEAAHRAGIVHRDVKPDNIFLISRGQHRDYVKVLDFGVAKLVSSPGELPVVKTISGAVVGTPAYMSPEQAAGLETDPRTDIYAVGNVLYRSLTGRLPFEAQSYGQLLVKIVSEPAPPIGETTANGESLPPELAAIVMSCLEKEPDKRPASMLHLSDLLEPFVSVPSAMALPMEPILHQTHRSWASSLLHGRSFYMAGALALVLLGSFAFLKRSRHAEPRAAVIGHPSLHAPEQSSRPAEPKTSDKPTVRTGATAQRTARPTAPPPSATVPLEVRSIPSGARVVRLDSGEELGKTPLAKQMPKLDREVTIRIELSGYQPAERSVQLDAAAVAEVRLESVASAPARKTRARPRPITNPDEGVRRDDVINPFER